MGLGIRLQKAMRRRVIVVRDPAAAEVVKILFTLFSYNKNLASI